MPAHPVTPGRFVWADGSLLELDDTSKAITLAPFSQALNYARTVISGIRVTPHFNDKGTLLVFALFDHLVRFMDSSARLGLSVPFKLEDLHEAVCRVVIANAHVLREGGYLRLLAYDPRSMISPQVTGPASVATFVAPFGEYIEPGSKFGVTFDQILRTGDLGRIKAASGYVNFAQARSRAARYTMDDSLGVMVDRGGKLIVGEGTTSNVFFVFGEDERAISIVTPPLDAGILAGVTRLHVMELAGYLGFHVAERDVSIAEVPLAREMFLTGTASYVIPCTHFGRHMLSTATGTRLNEFLRGVMAGEFAKLEHLNTVVKVSQQALVMA